MAKKSTDHHQSVRELELARGFARLLGVLPYEVILRMTDALVSRVPKSRCQLDLLKDDPFQVYCERAVGDDSGRRLDVMVPFALPLLRPEKSSEPLAGLCFELKLHADNYSQVTGYADARPSSVIISLSGTLTGVEKEVREKHPTVVRLTWTEWFWAFWDLLGTDAQRRLAGETTRPQRGLQITDVVRPLDIRCEMYVEDFLRDLKLKGLARVGSTRVMLVTGANATKTTANTGDGEGKGPNVYYCPRNWNREYRYICVVYHGKLQYIGEVQEQWIKEGDQFLRVDPSREDDFKGKEKDAAMKWLQGHQDDLYVALEEIKPDEWQMLPEDLSYKGSGPMTQSHRYFATPKDFVAALRNQKEEDQIFA